MAIARWRWWGREGAYRRTAAEGVRAAETDSVTSERGGRQSAELSGLREGGGTR